MKIIFSFLLLASFIPFKAQALPLTEDNSIESLIKCIGREEHKIHKKKVSGALYKLNMRMLEELVMFQKININAQAKKEICKSVTPPPSVRLLEYLVIYQDRVFDLSGKIHESEKELYRSSIKEFTDIIPELFQLYVSLLQATTPKPSCLEEHIPELKALHSDIQYLEGDVPIKVLLKQQNRGEKIMMKLRNFNKINETCEQDRQKKLEEEKKKKEQEAKENN